MSEKKNATNEEINARPIYSICGADSIIQIAYDRSVDENNPEWISELRNSEYGNAVMYFEFI